MRSLKLRLVKTVFVTVLLIGFSFNYLSAQAWKDLLPVKDASEYTLRDYQTAFNSYWDPFNVQEGFYLDANGEKQKARGWKQFKRWEWYWEPRVDPVNGSFPNVTSSQVNERWEQTHPSGDRSSTANWSLLGPTSSTGGYAGVGRINCIGYHPSDLNTFWVGAASGGLWETTDGGANWTVLTDNLDVLGLSDILINPDFASSGVMYIATGDKDHFDNRSIGVLKSTDGGVSWSGTGISYNVSQNKMVYRLLMDPLNDQHILAATTNGVYETTDGGTTWGTQLTTHKFVDMEYKPGNFSILYGSKTTGGEVFVSTDGGASWNSNLNTAGKRVELAVTPGNPNIVFALICASNNGLYGIYKSSDSGASFVQTFNGTVSGNNLLGWSTDGSDLGGQGWYDLCMAVSPTDTNKVFIGGVNNWGSTDGGGSWNLVNHWYGGGGVPAVHADKHWLSYRYNGDLFECNDGGVYISTDDGSTWTDKTNTMAISQIYRLGVSQTVATETQIGLQDNGTKLITGGVWSDVRGGDGMECIIDYTNVNTQYNTYVRGDIHRTYDHWTSNTHIQPAGSNGAWVTPYIMDPTDPNTLYAGYQHIYKTTNQGTSWTIIYNLNSSNRFRAMAIAPSNTQVLYASEPYVLWKTTDGGTSWSNITTGLPGSFITYIAVKEDDPNTLWVTLSTYSGNSVYESTNGGTSWSNITTGLPALPVNSIVQNKQVTTQVDLYVATDVGVYYKAGAANWVAFNTGLPNVDVQELEIYYDTTTPENSILRAASYGRGLWETPILVATSCTQLFLSEYGEPSSGNGKYIEIYNPTASAIDLSNYNIWKISNGGTWPEATITLTGETIAAHAVFVIGNNISDVPGADKYSTVINFNGDDAIGLAYNGGSGTTFSLIDAVGEDGPDPGSGWDVAGVTNATVNHTLVRKATVDAPNTNWASSAGTNTGDSEWIVQTYGQGDLGSHTSDCFIPPPCSLTITQAGEWNCNDNGTPNDPGDDWFSMEFNATVVSGGTQYEVVLNANPDGTGGTVLATENYDTAVIVGNASTPPFVADGFSTYDITIRDASDNTCFDVYTSNPVFSCSSSTNCGSSLLWAPSKIDDPTLRADISALIGGPVDYFDARTGTPSLALMQNYDAVFTFTSSEYFDQVGFGDLLADYVDAGGKAILGVLSTYNASGTFFGLKGRIMTVGYSPVNSPLVENTYAISSYAGDGTGPLFQGISSLTCLLQDVLALQGAGIANGSFLNGEIMSAYRPDEKVIYLNGFGDNLYGQTGDWEQLMANAVGSMGCGSSIDNHGGPTITDPCECAGGGEFDEEVVVTSSTGETWVVSANTGYLDPNTGLEFPVGTALTENPAGSGQYTLVGKHLDDVGYSLSVQGGGPDALPVTLSISNTCWYPVPSIDNLPLEICLSDDPLTMLGSAQLGDASGVATAEFEEWAIDGVGIMGSTFDPAVEGVGVHTVTYGFNALDDDPDEHHPGCYDNVIQDIEVLVPPDDPIVSNMDVCEGGSTNIIPQSTGGGGACLASVDLVISGVIDGPLSGGVPKAVEFYVINDIPNLSIYGFGSANNGGGSDGEEFTFPADPVTAGSYIWVATNTVSFNTFFGFDPTYTDGNAPNINGDDAIELFQNGSVIDVFGDINVDGTGQPWEYMDGWAYRVNDTGEDGTTFVLANWTFSGPNALDGATSNTSSNSPFPIGTYLCNAGSALFNFYGDSALTNLLAGPAVSYDPGTTPATSPDTVWVTTVDTSGCESSQVSVIINVYEQPVAEAGSNQSFCGMPVDVALTATANYPGEWTTSGLGTIANPASTSTTYTPVAADIATTVVMTWTTYQEVCGDVDDSMGILIVPETRDAEFIYPQTEYCPGSANPIPTHTTGVDGVYTWTVVSDGPNLVIDKYTGEIDMATSDWGTYDVTNTVMGCGNLIITGVIDGPLSGGVPKAVEFYALADIVDLSIYGFGSANNGGGSDGQEFTFPDDAVAAGTHIWVASEAVQFENFFGFPPTYINGSAPSINGDDAIELFCRNQVIDVFGEIDVDGSGQPWEYQDGWAYRVNNTDLDGEVFDIDHWTFSGPNALDGETDNNTAEVPFPIESFATSLSGICMDNEHTERVIIGDLIPPEILCPLDRFITLHPGDCSIFLAFDEPEVTDNCPGDPVITQVAGPPSGSEFDMNSSPFVITYEVYDANGNGPVYCSFEINIWGYPTPTSNMICNDEVQFSLDQNCEVNMNADKFLEGGPYQCYNIFEIFVDDPAYDGVNVSNQYINLDLGTYMVTVYDVASNNSCNTVMVVEDKIPPTIDCEECPVGGEWPVGSSPGTIDGLLTSADKSANLYKDCWQFGNHGHLPEFGSHFYDLYAIEVDNDGSYNIQASNLYDDAILGVFDGPFYNTDVCNNMIAGAGGLNDGLFGITFYTEPNLDVDLEAGKTYYVVVSTFDAFETGPYTISFSGVDTSHNVIMVDAVYSDDCQFAGCNEGFDILPVPTIVDNCGATLGEPILEELDGPLCGTKILRRTWTATDAAGMSASCTQEFLFFGVDLTHVEYPANWDGLPGHNPMLECDDNSYPLDYNGYPHPSFTGYPSGINESCGTIEVFYRDVEYDTDCVFGTKILRTWQVVDDCSGQLKEKVQIIRITDSTAPEIHLADETMSVSTNGWSCSTDLLVPEPEHLFDNCDALPRYSVEATAGNVYYDVTSDRWYVMGLPLGDHLISYTAIDVCGNYSHAEMAVTVYDGIPPVAVCEQFKQTSLTFDGIGTSKIWAEDFDSGSHDSGCGPVWFKVLRNDLGCPDLNGDDKPGGAIDIWFDDYVKYCCADAGTEVMTTLRVFDIDPGLGPIAPVRMEIGGDLYGHYNDCWTIVTVEEKIPPQMVCEDKYVTCEDSFDPYTNPGLGEPAVFSTCGDYSLEFSDDMSRLNVCGIGYITRTWTVFVGDEDKGSCKQRIYVEETAPFDPLTIVFPYITSMECLADPTGGEPTFDYNPCNVVDAEIVNIDTFRFVDDACYKILIDWVVIDWCVFEPNTGAELNVDEFRYISGNRRAILDPALFTEEDRDGYYKFTEVLMVYDQTPASIAVEDYCLPTLTCVTATQTHKIEATAVESDEDCGGEYSWKYVIHSMDTWEVIQYSHNNLDYKGNNYQGGVSGKSSKDKLFGTETGELTIIPALPIGQYRVTWTLSDGCSNTNQAYQYFTVADKKPPTPFLVDLSTALMTNCMVEICAITFDKGACDNDCLASYDNCSEVLYFTFTPVLPLIDHTWYLDAYGLYYFNFETGAKSTRAKYLLGEAHAWDPVTNSACRVYGVDADGNAPPPFVVVTVYVWDQFALNEDCDDGNYDFAEVDLILNNEGDDCPPTAGSLVSGMVKKAETNEEVADVELTIDNNQSGEFPKYLTAYGMYAFSGLVQGEYEISANKYNDYGNGVSTLDLVLIQKHLLGIKSLDNVYDLIASDANGSGSISAADLFEFRKLILGISETLPGDKSWRFIDKHYEFINPTSPWSELSDAEIIDLNITENSYGNDFWGIKLGDLNSSALANANAQVIEPRTNRSIKLIADNLEVEAGQMVEITFTSDGFNQVYGAQFTLNISEMTYAGVESGAINISDHNFGMIRPGILTMSWNNANGVSVSEDRVLFTLKLKSSVTADLNSLLSMSSDITEAEVYTGEDLVVNHIELSFRGAETQVFELYQNEPNPFSEETLIGFNLPDAANYTLTIFDVTGKVVKLIEGEGDKGFNSVTLDRKDISSGVMYYQLESGEHTATKKMIIIQ